MKPTKTYKILKDESSSQLESQVNQYMKMNFKLIGGLSTHLSTSGSGEITYYFQSVYGYPVSEYFVEVKGLAGAGNKLAAIKLLMKKSGMGLKDSKDWVDENC